MLWDGIYWLTSRPISFTASISCYGHSEKPEQSLSSKYVCIIVLHDCVPKQQHPPPNAVQHLLYLVFSLRGASNLYNIWKLLYSVASPIFLVIFSATVYQEVTILFSPTRWMETVLYLHMRYSSFAHKLNSNLWIETWHSTFLFNNVKLL